MKRLMTLLLAAGLVAGSGVATSAGAVELQAGGAWEFGLSWWDSSFVRGDRDNKDIKGPGDRFYAKQRIRPEFRFVTDENLQAVLQLEIGDGDFGNDGWALGNDGKTVKVRYGYVDWTIPNTAFKVRMGMQPYLSPTYCFDTVLNADGAGVTVSGQLTDTIGLAMAWIRPWNSDTSVAHDAIDGFLLALPLTYDGVSVTPWAMFATAGSRALHALGNEDNASKFGPDQTGLMGVLPANVGLDRYFLQNHDHGGTMWWLGLGGKLDLFDPFSVAMDFVYGHSDFGTFRDSELNRNIDLKRAGWLLTAKAAYKMDFMTPTLIAWYGSGDNGNANDGSERLPTVRASGFGTSFGQRGGWYDDSSLTFGLAGSWGIGLHLDNISYVDKLTHNVRATFYKGTNNRAMIGDDTECKVSLNTEQDGAGVFYLTTHDSAWEFTIENSYQVYKNLTLGFDLGLITLDKDENTWGKRDDYDDRMWKIALTATYKF